MTDMDHAIRKMEICLNDQYGAKRISDTEGIPYTDVNEKLICCFAFPDETLRKKAIGGDGDTCPRFPELKLLFLCDTETGEIFTRVCQGEARGIPWETIEMLCRELEKDFR